MGYTFGDATRWQREGHPLTADEARQHFDLTSYGVFNSGQGVVQQWVDLAEMTRTTVEPQGPEQRICWDRWNRILRLGVAQDDDVARKFLGKPWVRVTKEAHNHSWWAAAEGRAEFSEPSREPGDAVGRELVTKVGGYYDLLPEEIYRKAVDQRWLVVRIHVTRFHGALRPEDEWEWEEPMYW
ncbi:hypothetical protein G9272_24115 [Streptomyces asoensis]|uniref:Pyridoxamine 5'-phosphate oxidase n=1 Tax=Streptomyces asoensis TaxID=249586 RepID=A0A6M4WYE9_9ACTN|nr:hypothetical protein [Streptomyces asoensis]QJT02986.1 hypothetical protein G9272_24115 [Streptomyces asoensis]